MNECPNCGRCCGYDGDGQLVCVCGYHEEYDVSNWTAHRGVGTLLDGRQVARSVYRDLRERKIKNYETL